MQLSFQKRGFHLTRPVDYEFDDDPMYYATTEYGNDDENDIKDTNGKVKRFKCDSCEKAFTRQDHLRRHVASVHQAQKNFYCDFCEKAFARKDYLKSHIASFHKDQKDTEVVQKNFNCDSCEWAFSR